MLGEEVLGGRQSNLWKGKVGDLSEEGKLWGAQPTRLENVGLRFGEMKRTMTSCFFPEAKVTS